MVRLLAQGRPHDIDKKWRQCDEGGNAAYWKEQYESLRSESYGEFSKNYAKAIGAFYLITFAAAAGGYFAASGAASLGGGALVQSTVGGAGGSLALEGSQHALGKIGGYDRNISGEEFSGLSYLKTGLEGGAFGLVAGAGGRFFSGKAPIVPTDIVPSEHSFQFLRL